jgi:Family of unknown function (DUF6529)
MSTDSTAANPVAQSIQNPSGEYQSGVSMNPFAPISPGTVLPAPVLPGPPAPEPGRGSGAARLIVPVAIGGAVALSLGVYGNLHEGTGIAVNLAGFSSPLTVKVWLASVAFVLAIVQLLSALAMWGRLPGVAHAPGWVWPLHKWSGRLAFLASVPVAMHCLYALGFAAYEPRVLVHSLLGCFFYGVFTTKMLVLSRKGLPGWSLPVFGGLVFTALVGLWLTSSLWFFTTSGITF